MKEDGPLFQERLRRRPFWMLVACALVNRTRWSQAEAVHRELVRTYRTPRGLAVAHPAEVMKVVSRLGFGRSRSRNLIELAGAWCRHGRTKRRTAESILLLPGCGRYAAASWAIFIEGRRPRVTDRELRKYLRRTA